MRLVLFMALSLTACNGIPPVKDVYRADGLAVYARLSPDEHPAPLSDEAFRNLFEGFRYEGALVPHKKLVVRHDGNRRSASFKMERGGKPVDCAAFSNLVSLEGTTHRAHFFGFACYNPTSPYIPVVVKIRAN